LEYISEIKILIEEIQGWLLAIVGGLSIIMIAIYGIRYIAGGVAEKVEAISNIKKTLIMGIGVFVLVWFGAYILNRFVNL
jgi:hypothetical protein